MPISYIAVFGGENRNIDGFKGLFSTFYLLFQLVTLAHPQGASPQGANSDIKISVTITNVPKKTSLKRLAWMQRQRYWVERTFEDGKSECGMADYQVRKWSAWHHHMALVMMSMVFMLSERIKHEGAYPLLTCADIEDLLAHFLPRRDVTKDEVTPPEGSAAPAPP